METLATVYPDSIIPLPQSPLLWYNALTLFKVQVISMPHPLCLLLIWLGVLSTLSFLLYGWDKAQAKLHRRRIPEVALLFCALLGGSAGALLGMALFRHKIRKPPFRYGVPLMLAAHAALLFYAAGQG